MTTLTPLSVGAARPAGRARETVDAEDIKEVQIWFGPPERPLFGWLAVPAGSVARGGVVLCPPMGEEGRSAHRTFRTLSRALAVSGFLALRFDYDGTGNSAGSLTEPDRVNAWQASVAAAAAILRSCGVTRLDGVGMRLGATLAAVVSAVVTDVSEPDTDHSTARDVPAPLFASLILWDPCGGHDFLREGRALHSLGQEEAEAVPGGAIDTPGFRYQSDTVEEMQALDLANLPDGIVVADRTMVLVRDDRILKKKVKRRLSTDPTIEWGTAFGQQAMIDVSPSSSTPPFQSIRHIVDWLSAAQDLPDAVPVSIPAGDQPVTITVPAFAGTSASINANSTSAIHSAGRLRVLEHARSFGSSGLRGVVTEPIDGATGAPWIILINVAVEHSIGPGRLWVQLARQWATLGFRCLRLDQSGVGDSPTRPGQTEDVIFATEWIGELPDVVDELRADGSPVVLFGLCSGGYMALEAALHTKVDDVIAINPRLRIRETSKGMPLYDPRRRAARPPSKLVARLALRKENLAGGIWRIYRQFALWHAPMAVLYLAARRGTHVRVVAGTRDSRGYREVVGWSVAQAFHGRWTRLLRFDRMDTLDHSLQLQSCQVMIQQATTDYLLDRYTAHPAVLPVAPSTR